VKTAGGSTWETLPRLSSASDNFCYSRSMNAFTESLYAEFTGKEDASSRTVGIFFLSSYDITCERDRKRKLLVAIQPKRPFLI
jgi:hypothetical protein